MIAFVTIGTLFFLIYCGRLVSDMPLVTSVLNFLPNYC